MTKNLYFRILAKTNTLNNKNNIGKYIIGSYRGLHVISKFCIGNRMSGGNQ